MTIPKTPSKTLTWDGLCDLIKAYYGLTSFSCAERWAGRYCFYVEAKWKLSDYDKQVVEAVKKETPLMPLYSILKDMCINGALKQGEYLVEG